MNGRDWRFFGRLHTKLYKRLGGRFVGSVGWGRKVLLLTTTGRKSGKQRDTLLVPKHPKPLRFSGKDRSG